MGRGSSSTIKRKEGEDCTVAGVCRFNGEVRAKEGMSTGSVDTGEMAWLLRSELMHLGCNQMPIV